MVHFQICNIMLRNLSENMDLEIKDQGPFVENFPQLDFLGIHGFPNEGYEPAVIFDYMMI